MENRERLFVYGTLQEPEIQQKIFGRKTAGLPDTLPGYRKSEVIIDDDKYLAIVPSAESGVDGFVLTITPSELKLIDDYETASYKRLDLTLQSGKHAWVYVKA